MLDAAAMGSASASANSDAALTGGMSARDAIRAIREVLAKAGQTSAALDARLLVMLATGLTHEELILRDTYTLTSQEAVALRGFVARRVAGEPVSRIRGWREFWGLRFEISPDTLDPRPDSERVVETALALMSRCDHGTRAPVVVDVGTGTGCLLLAVLHERPDAKGIGIDRSLPALAIASRNARSLGLYNRAAFLCGDWSAPLAPGIADIVICNPPYIPEADIAVLAKDVRNFDPHLALAGGKDGLFAYRAICREVGRCVAPGGHVLFEVGAGQAEAVTDIVAASGFSVLREKSLPRVDLAGVERVVAARRQASGVA
jgi:release factor glutamine methyltransferase